jgi:hypothetical protein
LVNINTKTGESSRAIVACPPAAPPLVDPASDRFWILRADGGLAQGHAAEMIMTLNELFVPQSDRLVHGDESSWSATNLWCGPVGVVGPATPRGPLVLVSPETSEPVVMHVDTPLAGTPVVAAGYLVLAADDGPVSLYDVRHRQPATSKFFPEAAAEKLPHWGTPGVLSDNQLLLSDGHERLFLLAINATDGSVELRAETTVTPALVSALVAAQTDAWGIDAGNRVCRITLPDLEVEPLVTLDAPAQWGPTKVGPHILLATTAGEVHLLAAAPNQRWRLQLDLAKVVGGCVIGPDHVALASSCGRIAIIDAASGQQLPDLDVAQPVAFGPVVIKDRLGVLTTDSCLLLAEQSIEELLARVPLDEPTN